MTTVTPLFPLGNVYTTPGVLETIPEDKQENEVSLQRRSRLLSAYHAQTGMKFWIITEADRSATTLLLPSEY